MNLPSADGTGVVDCFFQPEGDDTVFSSVKEAHTQIVDQVVEVDEALMEQYLESGEVSPEQLRDPFKRALREAHLVPVCFTSAREGVGVRELMDIFAQLCPSPAEGNPHPFVYGSGDEKQTLVAAAERAGKLFVVIQNRRYHASIRRLGRFLRAGTIGQITTLDSDFYIGAHFGGHIFGSAMPKAKIQVGGQRGVAVLGKFARGLAIPFIPAGHMVNDDHAGKRAGAERAREVGIDEVMIRAR